MKFVISSSTLLKHLSTINGVIASNPIVPILENFLFQLDKSNLTVTASDMQTVMITEFEVESRDSGSFAVPARLLLDTLRSLPEQPVQINIDEETFGTELVTANGRYKLAGENPMDFPRVPQVNRTFSIEMDSDTLASAIANTIFATSTDDLRPAMTGVFVQVSESSTTFVATDGHRLIRYRREDVTSPNSTTMILPRKALNLLKSSLPAEMMPVKAEFSNSNAFFSFGHIKMICRLIDERFPDYENVIPQNNPNKLRIERTELLSTLKRISIYSNKTTHQIRLKISQNELVISAEDLDYSNEATEKLSCEYDGEEMEIGFNAKFLIEMLNNLSVKNISLEMSQPNRAGLIIPVEKTENEDTLMLVMPVMLNTYA
ncbi:MAG: DNA polymerase III subunit beta [Emticicia sp.]|uniref:Beta sliding clamp n=1 Tax=Emticicia aquatilis TaxID=1537369 RepID=A0A916Z4J9_9BACT|nr:DNA polymerase III subunit beta [Emticicia aquatilis]GGD75951.1 DNA polymerase III subunit beta [Emticicia aquatilis]